MMTATGGSVEAATQQHHTTHAKSRYFSVLNSTDSSVVLEPPKKIVIFKYHVMSMTNNVATEKNGTKFFLCSITAFCGGMASHHYRKNDDNKISHLFGPQFYTQQTRHIRTIQWVCYKM